MSAKVICTQQLTKNYGRRIGIDSVDLSIEQGDIFGFLGPNGAGKTTTIRVLLGFLRPSSGSAQILSRDCWRESHLIKQDIGYLPGDLRLYPWLTGKSALSIFGGIRGVDWSAKGAELVERFSLDTNVPVRKMSRGMRQKLGLILTLAHQPRLLILDEPTSALDPLAQQELAGCLQEMAAQGHTIFFSSHTLSEVEQLCDRIAIVRAGRIVADESLDALRSRARRLVTLWFADTRAAEQVEPPPFLSINERKSTQWRGELAGEAGELIQWAAGQPIIDLTISPPDLESLFQRYYQDSDVAT